MVALNDIVLSSSELRNLHRRPQGIVFMETQFKILSVLFIILTEHDLFCSHKLHITFAIVILFESGTPKIHHLGISWDLFQPVVLIQKCVCTKNLAIHEHSCPEMRILTEPHGQEFGHKRCDTSCALHLSFQ